MYFFTCAFVTILLVIGVITSAAAEQPAKSGDASQLQRGERIYQRFCSYCHGIKLEGQPDWRTRKLDGKLPAPPHDETGHTWHHPDAVLFGIVKHGMVPPYAPASYPSDMPAWGEVLKDEDIHAVLAYIKSRWPAGAHKIQQEIDQDYRRLNP